MSGYVHVGHFYRALVLSVGFIFSWISLRAAAHVFRSVNFPICPTAANLRLLFFDKLTAFQWQHRRPTQSYLFARVGRQQKGEQAHERDDGRRYNHVDDVVERSSPQTDAVCDINVRLRSEFEKISYASFARRLYSKPHSTQCLPIADKLSGETDGGQIAISRSIQRFHSLFIVQSTACRMVTGTLEATDIFAPCRCKCV